MGCLLCGNNKELKVWVDPELTVDSLRHGVCVDCYDVWNASMIVSTNEVENAFESIDRKLANWQTNLTYGSIALGYLKETLVHLRQVYATLAKITPQDSDLKLIIEDGTRFANQLRDRMRRSFNS